MTQVYRPETMTVPDQYTFEIEVCLRDNLVAVLLVPARDYPEAVEKALHSVTVRPSERLVPTINLI